MAANLNFVGFILLIFYTLQSNVNSTNVPKFTYEIRKYTVPVDHFNFANNATFDLRYLYNDSFVDKSKPHPIFFYTGNEGDIELFAQNTGFMWDLAEKLRGCVIFAEHRYYGKSLPFGDQSFNQTANLGYLSVEQTLEDYVKLITYLKGDKLLPVISIGGSYGGMLAAWLRIKYPHIVDGALAASAPIWQFNGLTPCDIFYKITTSVFNTAYSSNCSVNIKNSWSMFNNLSATQEGRNHLNLQLKFCDPLKQEDDVKEFFDYLEDVYGNLAMANYPYDNQFLAPLPAYPVRQFCFYLKDIRRGLDLLNVMTKALSVYSNYTGQSKCLDYKSAYGTDLGGYAWDIQTCNQMVMPMCANSETIFQSKPWNFKAYSDNCFQKFKIRPKEDDITIRYGGKHLETASNIIFSNGLLDPWSGGGVLQNINNKIAIIIIPEGAHHLDLRAADSADPISVQEAREKETQIISFWIKSYLNQL